VNKWLRFLAEEGSLLICEYRSSKAVSSDPRVDEELREYGFRVLDSKSAICVGQELTRVALLRKDQE